MCNVSGQTHIIWVADGKLAEMGNLRGLGPFSASNSANPMENVAHGHCRTVLGHKIVTLFCAMSM